MASSAYATVLSVLEQAERDEATKSGPLSQYFGRGTRDAYTGSQFETIGGYWNQPENLYCITAGDLVALATLSVSVSGRAATEILSEPFQRQASELLCQISPTLSIIDADATYQLSNPDSAASRLWRLFRPATSSDGDNVDQFGQVRTSKLLARKRPALLPVYDSVVGGVLGLRGSVGHWELMHELMTDDANALWKRAEELRDQVGLADTVTPLRVVDIVLWMHGKSVGLEEPDEM